jgi:CHASE3 domain sensor protein
MDLTSAEDSNAVRIACGLVLAIICIAMCSRFALNHTFIKVEHSVAGGLTVVETIDSIVENLDLLTMNQRAFLYTGDEHFTEEVAVSVMTMDHDIDTLEQISTNRALLRSYVTILSHRIKLALDSIRETYDLQQHFGATVAIALLDDDDAIDSAKQEALSIKRVATDGMFDRVQTECRLRSILGLLF